MKKHEVHLLLKQRVPVSIPNSIQPIRKGGMFRDGAWIAQFWLLESIDDMKDLPMFARILRCVNDKVSIRASEIAPGMTGLVVKTVERYRFELMVKNNVEIIKKRGGITLRLRYVPRKKRVTWR